jgi:hypothetical protein
LTRIAVALLVAGGLACAAPAMAAPPVPTAATAPPAAVGTTINTKGQLGSLKTGMKMPAAVKLLGRPTQTVRTSYLITYSYSQYGLQLLGKNAKGLLSEIRITSSQYQLPGGISIGSSSSLVPAALPAAQCNGGTVTGSCSYVTSGTTVQFAYDNSAVAFIDLVDTAAP